MRSLQHGLQCVKAINLRSEKKPVDLLCALYDKLLHPVL